MDGLVVEVDELAEAQHLAVEVHEPIHVAERHVANAMVDHLERLAGACRRGVLDPTEPWRVGAGVVGPIDEGVDHLAISVDRRSPEHALVAGGFGRLQGRDGTTGRRLSPGGRGVVHRKGDVMHAVAVFPDVVGHLTVGGDRGGEDEPNVVLDQHIAGSVANPGLQSGIRDRGEPPQRAEVLRRLFRVPDPELDVVDALEGQEISRFRGRSRLRRGHETDGTPSVHGIPPARRLPYPPPECAPPEVPNFCLALRCSAPACPRPSRRRQSSLPPAHRLRPSGIGHLAVSRSNCGHRAGSAST